MREETLRERFWREGSMNRNDAVKSPLLEMGEFRKWLENEYNKLQSENKRLIEQLDKSYQDNMELVAERNIYKRQFDELKREIEK